MASIPAIRVGEVPLDVAQSVDTYSKQEWPSNGFGPWKAKFTNATAAKAWLEAPKKLPHHIDRDGTITDPTISLAETDIDMWAKAIYDAMRNVSGIVELEHSAVVKGLKNEVIYSQEHMEAAAYRVVLEAIKLHKRGRCFPDQWDHSHTSKDMACAQKYNGRYDENFHLLDRLEAIKDLLKECKGAVRGVLEGDLPLLKLVNAPLASAKNRQNQRRSNVNKAAYIRDGITARQAKGVECPTKRKRGERISSPQSPRENTIHANKQIPVSGTTKRRRTKETSNVAVEADGAS